MPIYEYICDECNHEFEELTLSPHDPPPQCPECSKPNVRKLMSCGWVRPNGIPTGGGGFKPPACKPSG